jgi:LPXTG-motif cell wall-anchored protein
MTSAPSAFHHARVRHLWRTLFILLVCFGVTAPAFAQAAPITGTYTGRVRGREVTFQQNGQPRTVWAGVLNLRLDSGEDLPIFCIEIDVLVRQGDRYRSNGPIQQLPNGGCKIAYLLEKYPASTATTELEAAARQMAIWVFSDNIDYTTITDTALRDRVQALVDEANAAPCPTTQNNIPDLRIEPPTASATAGQKLTYTVHAGPAGAGKTVTITITGPAVLPNGQQQIDLTLDAEGNATFEVTGTGAGESTITAALPYQLVAGTVFVPLEDGNRTQRLVIAETRELLVKANAQAVWAAGAPSPTATLPAPTATPLPTQTPAPTTVPREEEQATPTPVPTEVTPIVGGEQISPTVEVGATPTLAPEMAMPQPAGAAPAPQELPRTGEPASMPIGVLGTGAAALLLGSGWLIRKRRARR